MSLAGNVRTLRVAAGLSVEDLAAATNLGPALIRSIENGAVTGSVGEIQAIARRFRMTEEMVRADGEGV